MSGLRRALIALAVAGLALGLAALALVTASDREADPAAWIVLALTLGWGFAFAGIFAWWRRPENRIGPLMTLVGFMWFLGALTSADTAWAYTLGVVARHALARRPRAHARRLPDRPGGAGARAWPGGPGLVRVGRAALPRGARDGASERLPGLPGQPAAGLGQRYGIVGRRGDRPRPLRRPARRPRRGPDPALARLRQGPAASARARRVDGSRGRRRGPDQRASDRLRRRRGLAGRGCRADPPDHRAAVRVPGRPDALQPVAGGRGQRPLRAARRGERARRARRGARRRLARARVLAARSGPLCRCAGPRRGAAGPRR